MGRWGRERERRGDLPWVVGAICEEGVGVESGGSVGDWSFQKDVGAGCGCQG